MAKEILFGTEARMAFKVGIDKVADAVKTTLGYGGRNVFISHNSLQAPESTKDGVTVAKSIYLKDPIANAGALAIRDVAARTANVAGDGTTTSTLLAQSIITEGLKVISSGANPAEVKKGIERATYHVVEKLKGLSQPIENDNLKINQVATLSANGDSEIGGLIAEAFAKIGNGVHIVMEDSKNEKTFITYEEGYQFERGWGSPFWVTNGEKMIAELKDPVILLFDGKLSAWPDMKPILDMMMKQQKRELLIICEEVDGQLRDTLIRNKVEGIINVVCVVSPSYGERRKQMMEDIAILTNSTFVSPASGHKLKDCNMETAEKWLGTCSKVVVTKDSTTIVSGANRQADIDTQVVKINALIDQSESEIEKEHLAQRISKLTSSIAILSVGGMTSLEMKEKKYRVEDAIRATNAAIEEGILPGGGTSLIRCVDMLSDMPGTKDERKGIRIIQSAIKSPLNQICFNVGKISLSKKWWQFWKRSSLSVYDKVYAESGNIGYNAKTDQIEDMIKAGIIDPTKVVRVALENAASIGAMVLITECLICETDVAK